MDFNFWDKLFNLLFLLIWFQIWNRGERESRLNPHLGMVYRWGDAIVRYVKPVLFGLPDRGVAAVILVVLILVRGGLVFGEVQWDLVIGFAHYRAVAHNLLSTTAFSLASFGLFLFQVWGLTLLYVHAKPQHIFDSTSDTLYRLGRPFTDTRFEIRPVVLAVVGMLLVAVLAHLGLPRNGLTPSTALSAGQPLILSFIASMAGWVSILLTVRTLLILLIIGSWVSLFTGTHNLMLFCREWLDFLLGPARRYPLRLGPIDLTPLIVIFGLEFVYQFIMYVLVESARRLVV